MDGMENRQRLTPAGRKAWDDFSLAEQSGEGSIRRMFARYFGPDADRDVPLADLRAVLDYKQWYWFERDDEYNGLYSDLFDEVSATIKSDN